MKPMIEEFYQTFEFAELQINMEVFNGSWEAIAQGRADVVIGATSAIPVGGDFEVKDMGSWVGHLSHVTQSPLCARTKPQ